MKIFHALFLFIIIFSLLLTSCTNQSKNNIIQDAENFISTSTLQDDSLSIHFGYQSELGNWLKDEQKYTYDKLGDNSTGITCLSKGNFVHIQDRLYFQLTKQTEFSTGDNFWAYVSTETGEKHYLCPDPLCSHTIDSGCPYIEFSQLTFHPYTDTIVYAVRQSFINNAISSIFEIDLQQNKIKEIYNATTIENTAEADYINIYFILNDVLYFRDRFVYEEIVDGEKIISEKTYLLSYDLKKQKINLLNDNFNPYIGSIYIINDKVFYTDLDQKTVFCTDFDMNNPIPVLTYDEGYQIADKFYDENTEELFLLISKSDLQNAALLIENTETINCTLYCINKNLECTKLPMPSSLLLDIQLTNNYIYYTTYDPINYKTPPYTRNAVDISGNKIYRVKRIDTTIPELVFDGHGELFFRDFFVTGDYIYMEYYGLVVREEGQVFRRMGSSLRINIKDDTKKWMNLD